MLYYMINGYNIEYLSRISYFFKTSLNYIKTSFFGNGKGFRIWLNPLNNPTRFGRNSKKISIPTSDVQ
ncbi:hypothetical protein SAMN05444390_102482 [Marinobacterium lutimaris]|uniref:Uncharacterized protein n=1 Tax=Marinobacterium lutimaris TaxID=568106 RepID=A0A1H6B8Z8_9GAMM|nr:hypothetical protein SAMN05444390_102482 [Marinobacterium lutimaris]